MSAAKTKPAVSATEITLADTGEYSPPYRSLYIGGAGDLKVTTANDEDVTFVGLAAGSILPVEIKLAWSTGSTASSIIGLR